MINVFAIPLKFFAILVGGLPTGYWFARFKGIADIRQHGSGNIGATNIGRVLGIQYFFVIFMIDVLKAFLVMMLARALGLSPISVFLVAAMIMLGNCFSPFLQGKGGKGVSTSIGIMAALNAHIVAIIFGMWGITFLVTRTVGIASVIGFLCLPLVAWAMQQSNHIFPVAIVLSICGIYRHQDNIRKYVDFL